MKFIADSMLGRLARWLRLLGFDTLYQRDISDPELLKLAKAQDRTILTRDTHFLGIKNLKNLLFIKSDDPLEQLKEVLGDLRAKPAGRGRCANCNGALHDVQRKEIEGSVPEHVFLNFHDFLKCPDCGNVYWEGSQYQKFRQMFYDIIKGVK